MTFLLGIVETADREISIVNQEWIKSAYVLWPPKQLSQCKQRKYLETLSNEGWEKVYDFKILQIGIGDYEIFKHFKHSFNAYFQDSIEYANERLIFYSLYENTMDKVRSDEEKAERRLHPVNHIENNMHHLNYNSMFNDVDLPCSTPNAKVSQVSLSRNNWFLFQRQRLK